MPRANDYKISDKKIEEMDDEEKEVFKVLDEKDAVEEGEIVFGEIDDDFILMLNGGKPALELVSSI